MQPNKTSVTGLFNSPCQYQVPIFQRGYVWTLEKQVVPLWEDIQDRADSLQQHQSLGNNAMLKPLQKHFLGSVVLTPVGNKFGRVPSYEVIDGQQRSTTLHLLLLAFSIAAKTANNSTLQQMLGPLIRNPGPYTEPNDRHKVWPTQAGQAEMQRLNTAETAEDIATNYPVRDGRKKLERPLMIQTFLYLYHACLAYMKGIDLRDLADPENAESSTTHSNALIKQIRNDNDISFLSNHHAIDTQRAETLYMTLTDHIQLMTLVLEAEDDPQVIFETLNARGEPLLASDLIRNFLFLEAVRSGQAVDALYDKYWRDFDQITTSNQSVTANSYWREKVTQGRVTYPRIDFFFYNYTVLRSQETTLLSHVFYGFKAWWLQEKSRDLPTELQRIKVLSQYFSELLSPTGTSFLAEFARLVNSLDVSTIAPVYLVLRERLPSDSPELKQAIGDLASYLVRRCVCGLSTKSYNRFFLTVLQAISASDAPHQALRQALLDAKADSECWPDDVAFEHKWLQSPVYLTMKPRRVVALLRALEYAARGANQGSFDVPEQSSLQVEHVMPQTWKDLPYYSSSAMTEEQSQRRQDALHRFGNLTILTAPLNASVSNKPFSDVTNEDNQFMLGKRSTLGQSALTINQYFHQSAVVDWDDAAIHRRNQYLFKAANMVWGRPSNLTQNKFNKLVCDALSGI